LNPGSNSSALVAETNGSGYAGEFLGNLKLTGSISFADASTLTTAKTDCMGGRYEDNGDGTVSDCRTGLIWLKDTNCTETSGGIVKNTTIIFIGQPLTGTLNWVDAGTWVAGLHSGLCGLLDGSFAGDWRLPTKTEWMAMVAYAKSRYNNPALTNAAGTAQWTQGDTFSNVQSFAYWSGTTLSSSTAFAYIVNMSVGKVDAVGNKGNGYYVWPVRAGQ
jgi:hypothetical protein